MLIYNYRKEFLGIDEKDLKKLGLENLAALKAEAADFADLFIKKPGYIHNFKHVHWIDFISCAESSEESKALISVNSQTFKCNISIDIAYLVDNPDSPAYIIHLNNLRALRDDETQGLSIDTFDRPTPQPAVEKKVAATPPPPPPVEESYEQLDVDFDETPVTDEFDSIEIEETPLQVETPQVTTTQNNLDDMLDVGDLSLDIDEPLDIIEEKEAPSIEREQVSTPSPVQKTIQVSKVVDDSPDYVSDYKYDPSIASKELGLPLDLIEEFIQDFIDQAKDFKEGLYNALDSDDIDTVKILSHKLKGVAANLRIEDAYEILSVINTTSDMNIVKTNLSIFYKIIAKLAGEEVAPQTVVVEETVIEDTYEEPAIVEESQTIETPLEVDSADEDMPLEINLDDDDDFTLDFKEDSVQEERSPSSNIEDSEVPHKIDLPELADDDFLEEDSSLSADENIDIAVEDSFDDITLEIGSDTDLDETPNIEIDYSKEEIANEIGIDIESFNELFEDFVEESHSIFKRINDAIEQDDYAACRSEALKLKGMSDNMRLHEFTNELETLIHSSDKEEIAQAITKIDKTITKISKVGA